MVFSNAAHVQFDAVFLLDELPNGRPTTQEEVLLKLLGAFVSRLYTAEGLPIRKRKKGKRIGVRVPLVTAMTVNQTWSMDFVSDAIARARAVSRRIKCLMVADDLRHECVDIAADFGIGGAYVTRLLDRAATFRGCCG